MAEIEYYQGALTGEEIDALANRLGSNNLLDNWYFIGGGSQQGGGQFPINQRGNTLYNGNSIYGIDRWKSDDTGTGYITLQSDGLHMGQSGASSACLIDQLIEMNPLPQGTYTLSCLFTGHVRVNTNIAGETKRSSYKVASTPDIVSVTVEVPDNPTSSSNGVWITSYTGVESVIYAVKLERGSTQTLAYKDAGGNWQLNELPNYQDQLLRCKRYFQRIKETNGDGNNVVGVARMYRTGRWTGAIFLSAPMRSSAPTMTMSNVGVAFYDGDNSYTNYTFVANPTSIIMSDNAIKFTLNDSSNYTGAYRNAMEFLQLHSSASYIDISCDL
jgi:hypothetical protein